MGVDSLAVGLVVTPLSHIDVSVSVYKSAVSMGLVILPVALVDSAVLPLLLPSAFSSAPHPLTRILVSVSQFETA